MVAAVVIAERGRDGVSIRKVGRVLPAEVVL